MMKMTNSLAALPFGAIARRPDLLLAVGVASIAGMLIIPLPTMALDALISVNIAIGVLMLLVALFARRALDVSSFPSLLLITTLFRLGLNVSTTRGILARADAGDVVKSFGTFVLQGDVIVGMVIFLVITLVQFLVIAKGSERVAEVAARFTLDAMPGKQMSIDAALRAGFFTEEEAQEKRDELGRESQMFGNMDGAMKFVKGDAIAGLIITALNLVAGFAIGVGRNDMPLDAALQTYSVLTVGDGLVSQISALLITLSAGIVVTRVQGKNQDDNLGNTIQNEYLANAKVLNVGAGLLFVLGLMPGLPFVPFASIGFGLVAMGVGRKVFKAHELKERARTNPEVAAQLQLEKKLEAAKHQKSVAERLTPTVVPLSIDLSPDLSEALGFEENGSDVGDAKELMDTFIPQLRDALYLETGVRLPGVRVRSLCRELPNGSFVVRIREVPVLQESIDPSRFMATTTVENVRRFGIIAQAGVHPISGSEVAMITVEQKAVVEAAGITVWSPAGLIALFMASVLRRRIKDFIGLQETSELIERLEKAYPALVKEVIPKVVTVPQLMDVLRRLVDERICVRDLKAIVEALGEHGARMNEPVALTERVRASLSHQIAYEYAGLTKFLHVVLVDPVIEDTVLGAIHQGHGLALEPELCSGIIDAVQRALEPMLQIGARPVLLTTSSVRRYLKKLIEIDLPNVAVLGFEELPADLTIQPMGRAEINDLEAA